MINKSSKNAKNTLSEFIATDVTKLKNTDKTNDKISTATVHLCVVDTFKSGREILNFFRFGMSDLSKVKFSP